jgi:hypothetical protein
MLAAATLAAIGWHTLEKWRAQAAKLLDCSRGHSRPVILDLLLSGGQDMRLSVLAMTAAACLLAGTNHAAGAFDSKQFCQAVTQWVRAAVGDAGTWVDRTTRNDGVEIVCDRKIVHFKRYSTLPARVTDEAWKDAKINEWRGATCADSMWREAIENGWLISATVASKDGKRVLLACQPGGAGFFRVLPP